MSGITYRLVGVDGSEWPLSEADGMVRLVADPEGIGGPTTAVAWQENVGQGGSTYKGQQDKPLAIKCLYRFGGRHLFTGDQVQAGAAAWRRALGMGDQVAEFHVIETVATADGPVSYDRWVWVRNLDSHQGPPPQRLRDLGGWNQGSVVLTSGGSRWNGTTEPLELFAGDLTGHTITNAGDYEAWPQWQIDGPTTGLKIGLGTEAIALANIAAGQQYRIDTNPSAPQVHRDGVDVWASAVGRHSWRRPVAAGESVAVVVQGAAAAVTVTLPLEYQAAIG